MSGTDRSAEVYAAAVRREFAFLKGTRALADLHARSIVLPGDRGLLVPVCELHADDDTLIEILSRWRDEHARAFPTSFPVTAAGTARWLRAGLLGVEDRILFLVCDRHGHTVGHLGFAGALAGDGSMMIDNVVRGLRDADPGLMSVALTALVHWATEMFAPRAIDLLVFEDNPHAVRFYERLGFATSSHIALTRTEPAPGTVTYVPARPGEPADRRFLRMTYEEPAHEPAPILTAGPSMSARESSYALDAVRNGWNNRHSGYLDAFSAAFARYVGVKHALPTSSCTGALHLSLLALGVGPGDEVVVPDLTWVATANAVAYTGATPVFADVEPDSWCLDPEAFRAAITPRTKAVMPVHLYGHPSRMDAITQIARTHDVRIVEDAAPSIGAEVAGRRTGAFGDAAAFSFQGAKLLVAGEGGMLVTDSDEVYERARYLWTMGHEGEFWIGETGVKYKMSNVQAAVGLGQLERVEQLVEAKRRIFGWYEEELGDTAGLTLNREAHWARSIYWMSSVIVEPEAGLDRDGLRAALRATGIDTRPHRPACHQPAQRRLPASRRGGARRRGDAPRPGRRGAAAPSRPHRAGS